ncbi:hypothetical protein NHX12_031682 [Muraenolepis orangiensis]|uniref:Uncharacterized protein n=1 Tax=Muraenolepis orangiensis TaxID=630683 RepID=A0A9Q0E628_9TELE|nr:hypothetical protein NHX12_031682 [Muraenolepis orangiensis]
MVRPTFRCLSVLVAMLEVSSFVCLVVAVSTDYWYIIDTSRWVNNLSLAQSSHSGLWRVCYEHWWSLESGNLIILLVSSDMQRAFSVLLPLGAIVLVVGGVLGFLGLLARSRNLLTITGILLLLGCKDHGTP